AQLFGLAVDPLEGHVLGAAQAAGNQRVADHVLRVDGERRAVDVVAESALAPDLEFQQRGALRRGRHRRHGIGLLLADQPLVLPLPLAFAGGGMVAARECQGEQRGGCESLQARSRARAARISGETGSSAALYAGWSTPMASTAPCFRRAAAAPSSNRR